MNPGSWLVYTISDSIYWSITANQGKGTVNPAEKVTATNEESPGSTDYLPYWRPPPQPRDFSEAGTCGLGSSLEVRSKAEPDLLCVWETTAANSDPSHSGLSFLRWLITEANKENQPQNII